MFDRVQEINPKQTPSRQFDLQGEFYIARSPRSATGSTPTIAELHTDLHADIVVATRAVSALNKIANADDRPAAAASLALRDAATDPEVAVVLLTVAGRAFSAGNDLNEMQRRITDPAFNSQGSHFSTMIDALTDLPKPLICAVNGVGVGIGATILGYADLVFMSTSARLKTPFTSQTNDALNRNAPISVPSSG